LARSRATTGRKNLPHTTCELNSYEILSGNLTRGGQYDAAVSVSVKAMCSRRLPKDAPAIHSSHVRRGWTVDQETARVDRASLPPFRIPNDHCYFTLDDVNSETSGSFLRALRFTAKIHAAVASCPRSSKFSYDDGGH